MLPSKAFHHVAEDFTCNLSVSNILENSSVNDRNDTRWMLVLRSYLLLRSSTTVSVLETNYTLFERNVLLEIRNKYNFPSFNLPYIVDCILYSAVSVMSCLFPPTHSTTRSGPHLATVEFTGFSTTHFSTTTTQTNRSVDYRS